MQRGGVENLDGGGVDLDGSVHRRSGGRRRRFGWRRRRLDGGGVNLEMRRRGGECDETEIGGGAS